MWSSGFAESERMKYFECLTFKRESGCCGFNLCLRRFHNFLLVLVDKIVGRIAQLLQNGVQALQMVFECCSQVRTVAVLGQLSLLGSEQQLSVQACVRKVAFWATAVQHGIAIIWFTRFWQRIRRAGRWVQTSETIVGAEHGMSKTSARGHQRTAHSFFG